MRALWLSVAALGVLGTGACGDDGKLPPGQEIPEDPTLRVPQAFAVFEVTPAGSNDTVNLFFFNDGREDLVFESFTVEDDQSDSFTITQMIPDSRTAATGEAVTVVVEFAPATRGIALAALRATSNAVLDSDVRIELVGPAGSSPLAPGPDLVVFEDPVEAIGTADVQAAYVRYFNVGQGSFSVSSYAIVGDADGAFAFAAGTVLPSAAIPVLVAAGEWVVVTVLYTPPGEGTHRADLEIVHSDPDPTNPTYTDRVQSVGLSGSN